MYSDPTGLLAGGGGVYVGTETPWCDPSWYGGVSPFDATADANERQAESKTDREQREKREKQQKISGGKQEVKEEEAKVGASVDFGQTFMLGKMKNGGK